MLNTRVRGATAIGLGVDHTHFDNDSRCCSCSLFSRAMLALILQNHIYGGYKPSDIKIITPYSAQRLLYNEYHLKHQVGLAICPSDDVGYDLLLFEDIDVDCSRNGPVYYFPSARQLILPLISNTTAKTAIWRAKSMNAFHIVYRSIGIYGLQPVGRPLTHPGNSGGHR